MRVVWQPDAPGGPALWLDADGDGRLAAAERHPFPGKTLELPARVRVGGATFTRNGTPGQINSVSIPFDNDGTVHLMAGNLNLSGGNSAAATDSGA